MLPASFSALPAERCVSARRGWAGKNRGLFEHPVVIVISILYEMFSHMFRAHQRLLRPESGEDQVEDRGLATQVWW